MKVAAAFSLLGLLAPTSFAAPSEYQKRDVNIFLHEPAAAPVPVGKTLDGPLDPGYYTITSPGLTPGQVIGRYYVEDRSLYPKRILNVPADGPHQTKWKVEQLESGNYRLSVGYPPFGPATKLSDNKLYASLIQDDSPSEWVIIPQGPNVYSIADTGSPFFWSVGPNELDQVQLAPALPGVPFQVFKFIPVDDNQSQARKEEVNDFLHVSTSGKGSLKKSHIDIKLTVEEL